MLFNDRYGVYRFNERGFQIDAGLDGALSQ